MNLIEKKNQCIDDCSKDSEYKYYFRNKCYNECPVILTYESQTKDYYCEIKCNKSEPLEIVEFQNCTDFCGINEMYNKLCISKYQDNNTNGNLILKNILTDITTINFDTSVLNNEKIIINESFIDFIITNNKDENKVINLGTCENTLKSFYNIENNEDLIILIININKNNNIKKLLFEVYSKTEENTLKKLDLNICYNNSDNDIINNNDIIKCFNYTIDSILNESCITCKEPFYSKYEDSINNNTYIKCYKNIDGYYLFENKYFKKCYESCELCDKGGNNTEHNCIKCKDNYYYELNISSYINCYNQCDYNFYYDENNDKYYCTPNNNCVNFFDKLINNKKQCINDCSKDNDYPYEFQKRCYDDCPLNITEKSK